jgi:hypothetical protein
MRMTLHVEYFIQGNNFKPNRLVMAVRREEGDVLKLY